MDEEIRQLKEEWAQKEADLNLNTDDNDQYDDSINNVPTWQRISNTVKNVFDGEKEDTLDFDLGKLPERIYIDEEDDMSNIRSTPCTRMKSGVVMEGTNKQYYDIFDVLNVVVGDDDDGKGNLQNKKRGWFDWVMQEQPNKSTKRKKHYEETQMPKTVIGEGYKRYMKSKLQQVPWFRELLERVSAKEHRSLCEGTKTLTPHQIYANVHFRNVAHILKEYPDDYHMRVPHGMLMYHNTGSGKTSVQMGIVDAFWDLIRHYDEDEDDEPVKKWELYFVTTQQNKKDNNIAKFADWGWAYPNFCGLNRDDAIRKMSRCWTSKTGNENQFFENGKYSAEKFTKTTDNWLAYTTTKMMNYINRGDVMKKNRNYIFVCDEVQNLMSGKNKMYKFVHEAFKKAGANVIFIMLTATPGNIPAHAVDIINLTHLPDSEMRKELTSQGANVSPDVFKNAVKGSRVSYVDVSKFVSFYPEYEEVNVYVKFPDDHVSLNRKKKKSSGTQESYYREMYEGKGNKSKVSGERNTSKFDPNNPDLFMKRSREAANFFAGGWRYDKNVKACEKCQSVTHKCKDHEINLKK
jgi:hypothetical protein